jgi:hypothetical protein
MSVGKTGREAVQGARNVYNNDRTTFGEDQDMKKTKKKSSVKVKDLKAKDAASIKGGATRKVGAKVAEK